MATLQVLHASLRFTADPPAESDLCSPRSLRGIPLNCLYCTTSGADCQDLFQTFFKFFHLAFWRLAPLPWDNYSIAQGCMDCNRQNTQITGFLHPHLCALYILTKLLAAWYNGNSASHARARAANYSTLSTICQA